MVFPMNTISIQASRSQLEKKRPSLPSVSEGIYLHLLVLLTQANIGRRSLGTKPMNREKMYKNIKIGRIAAFDNMPVDIFCEVQTLHKLPMRDILL